MIKHNQDGAVSGLSLSLILSIILLVAAVGFGVWAFGSRQDYKDNTDAKISVAVKAAVAQNSADDAKKFAEQAKMPLTTYNGPEANGSLVVQYPKTWSVYDNGSGGSSGSVLDLYFNPVIVPTIGNQNSVYALHVQVINTAYSNAVQALTGQLDAGNLTVSAYSLPKLPNVVGVKAVGAINNQTEGTLIILPLRTQTIEIETDGNGSLNDFNKYILPNFSFSP